MISKVINHIHNPRSNYRPIHTPQMSIIALCIRIALRANSIDNSRKKK